MSPPVIRSGPIDGYAELGSEASGPQNGVGGYGRFEVTFDTAVVKYAYSFYTDPSPGSARTRTEVTESIWAVPTESGLNTLYVKAWDSSGTSEKVVDTTRNFTIAAWVKLSTKNASSVVAAQEGSRGSSFALR
jgi:hypothetical protein